MASEKVLIVEDEDNERTGLAELISAWGYRTEVARDGVEGMEKVLDWDPAIVVTDLRMPRMTVWSCWRRSPGSRSRWRWFCSPPRAASMPLWPP
jgi:CheY-like chemotaxis protein